MADSRILQQAINIKICSKKTATHFALCNGDRIRYLIALKGGKKRLSKNISTYSNKLGLLMKLLVFLPYDVLKSAKLGYFVEASLHPVIEQQRKTTGTALWNVIVGTYDEKQKLVLQCFDKAKDAIFIKIGNQSSVVEMNTEIDFLSEDRHYQSFDMPTLLNCCRMSENNPFNIQITKEFCGVKVEPVLTEDIVRIYHELSSEKKQINGTIYERSHGDFTPWNMKKLDGRITLFDWEHCGFRSQGYDLMHYMMSIAIALNGINLEEAYDNGIQEIKKFIPDFRADKVKILEDYKETIRELKY